MAEFLEDPSVLTKDKLKSELLANDVRLPSGEHKKDVYIQLYLNKLTVLNKKKNPPSDNFSSDEDLPSPVVSNRSRSGRKATRKTDKPWSEELDVSGLTDEDLKDQLLKYGTNAGPIVDSTRNLYEKKLQKLLNQPPPEMTLSAAASAAQAAITIKADGNQNGNTHSVHDQYSDNEEEQSAAPDGQTEPEPTPTVNKPVRSRGKTPVTVRTNSSRRKVEDRLAAGDQTLEVDGEDVLKELFPNKIDTPTGISATCRRPIHGAAGRPVKPIDLWPDNVHTEISSSYVESRPVLAAAPCGGVRARRSLSVWLKLLVFLTLTGSLYYILQSVNTKQIATVRNLLLDRVVTPIINAIGSDSTAESGSK